MEQDVRRLVLLSGRGEVEAERAERAVQETGADVTIVRCAWFMQNFSEEFLLQGVLDGEVVAPASDELEPFIDADDIADVAVAALTDDRHIGELYELTSPRLLTFPEAVGEIARATGREIRYVSISAQDYAAGAAEQGIPAEFVGFLTYLFGEVLGQQCVPDRRRAARARSRAARLQRLCTRHRGDRRVEPLGGECLRRRDAHVATRHGAAPGAFIRRAGRGRGIAVPTDRGLRRHR